MNGAADDDVQALVPAAATDSTDAADTVAADGHVGRAAAAHALREGMERAGEFRDAFAALNLAQQRGLPDSSEDGAAASKNNGDNNGGEASEWTAEDEAIARAAFHPRPAAFDEDSSDEDEEAGGTFPVSRPVAVDVSDEAMMDDSDDLAAMAARRAEVAHAAGYLALPVGDEDDEDDDAMDTGRAATLVAGEPGRAPTVMVADRTTVAMTSDEVTKIQSVMASFAIPETAVPAWARQLKDADWIPTLAFADEQGAAGSLDKASSRTSKAGKDKATEDDAGR